MIYTREIALAHIKSALNDQGLLLTDLDYITEDDYDKRDALRDAILYVLQENPHTMDIPTIAKLIHMKTKRLKKLTNIKGRFR